MAWREDGSLQEKLSTYVLQCLQRVELLDFVKKDFPQYKWSIRSLDRRLRFFNIFYTDRRVTLDEACAAVKEEMQGPGCLLGYRAMQLKIRQKYELKIPRDRIHD